MQTTTNQGQFSSILYEGGGVPNGIPAPVGTNGDIVAFTLGGFQNVNDSGGQAQFGVLMSSNPTDASGDGSFYVGIPTGYQIRGIVQYDGGIAMNDPAKPNYFLQGAPLTLLYRGSLLYYGADTSLIGAGVPNISDVVCVQNSTGLLDFMPPGTTQAQVPTGWTVLSQTQARVKSYDAITGASLIFFQL
jgi:hypothetical protein